MKQPLLIIILACLAWLTLSCADKNIVTTSQEGPATREALLVLQQPDNLILRLGGEPVQLATVCGRLVGVVDGVGRIACLDLGGQPAALSQGEMVDGYMVVDLTLNSLLLKRHGK